MKQKSLFKKMISAIAIIAIVPLLQGCDANDFAVGAAIVGAVAIGAACVASGADCSTDYDHHHYESHTVTHTDSYTWTDYRGNSHTESYSNSHTEPGRGPGGFNKYFNSSFTTKAAASQELVMEQNGMKATASDIALTYKISKKAAQKLILAFNLAQKGDRSGLRSLGLDPVDLQNLKHFDMPTLEGREAVAKNLDISQETVDEIFIKVLVDAEIEMKKASGEL